MSEVTQTRWRLPQPRFLHNSGRLRPNLPHRIALNLPMFPQSHLHGHVRQPEMMSCHVITSESAAACGRCPRRSSGRRPRAVDRFSRLSVSRATHLPAMRAAAGLLFWLTPPPCPSRAAAVAAEHQLVLMALQEIGRERRHRVTSRCCRNWRTDRRRDWDSRRAACRSRRRA